MDSESHSIDRHLPVGASGCRCDPRVSAALELILTYGVVSILTFLVSWYDKSAARNGQWRTKESSLLLLGLAGGWSGAVVAQRLLRHSPESVLFSWHSGEPS